MQLTGYSYKRAVVIESKYNCTYSSPYIDEIIEVVKCNKIKDCYKLKDSDILFHKEELKFLN